MPLTANDARTTYVASRNTTCDPQVNWHRICTSRVELHQLSRCSAMDPLLLFVISFEIGCLSGLPIILWLHDSRRRRSSSSLRPGKPVTPRTNQSVTQKIDLAA